MRRHSGGRSHCRLQGVHEQVGNIAAGLVKDLLKAGGAGDVDLGDAISYDVHARQQQTAALQDRAQRFGDLPVTRRQRARHAFAPRRKIAADFTALWNARQTKRHGLAANDEDAFVAFRDLRKEFLHHHALRTVAVERLGDAAQIQTVRANAENAHAPHAIERLENGSFAVFVLVLGGAAIAALWGWLTHQHPPSLAMATAGAVGVIVPAIGAAAMALEAKFQFEEQTERSAVVADRLEKLASELPGDLNLEAAQMALRATAELLVAEADQWQEGGRRRRLFRGG